MSAIGPVQTGVIGYLSRDPRQFCRLHRIVGETAQEQPRWIVEAASQAAKAIDLTLGRSARESATEEAA
jgi:hypothetical protein